MTMSTRLSHVYSLYAASSLDKQLALMDFLGKFDRWDFDLKRGELTFNQKHVFPAQVLGSESTSSRTWLWGWANTESGIPEQLLKTAKQLREFGSKHGIPELTTPQVQLGIVDGMTLASIACGLSRADGFYRGTYDGGALLVTFQAPVLKQRDDASSVHLVSIFGQLISGVAINHRTAWKGYLEQKNYSVIDTANSIIGTSKSGERVQATFDNLGRSTHIKALPKG